MMDFWVGSWLHCPPERAFTDGRRVIVKHLCFGPAEARSWFVTEDGCCWYEERIMEGCQAGEVYLEPCTREKLRAALEHEIELCRRFHGENLIPLFLSELETLVLFEI